MGEVFCSPSFFFFWFCLQALVAYFLDALGRPLGILLFLYILS